MQWPPVCTSEVTFLVYLMEHTRTHHTIPRGRGRGPRIRFHRATLLWEENDEFGNKMFHFNCIARNTYKFASYTNLARHPNCQTGDEESVQVRQKVSFQRQNGGVVPWYISSGCDFEYAPLKGIVQELLASDTVPQWGLEWIFRKNGPPTHISLTRKRKEILWWVQRVKYSSRLG